MPAAVYDIALEQGATFRFPSFQFGTRLDDEDGNPVLDGNGNQQIGVGRDFTGCTFKLTMRKSKKVTGEEIFTVTSEDTDGGISADAEGVVRIVVPDERTDAAAKGGYYDLKCYNPDGTEDRLVEGQVAVDPAVTIEA